MNDWWLKNLIRQNKCLVFAIRSGVSVTKTIISRYLIILKFNFIIINAKDSTFNESDFVNFDENESTNAYNLFIIYSIFLLVEMFMKFIVGSLNRSCLLGPVSTSLEDNPRIKKLLYFHAIFYCAYNSTGIYIYTFWTYFGQNLTTNVFEK